MGLVVAGDGRDYPGLDRRPQAVAVGLGAQRRLHVIEAGEVAQGLIGQDQLIQGHVGSHRQAACLGVGNHLRAASTGQLAEVSAHARLFHQQQVTGQGHGFGAFRDAGQAEEARCRPFMGDAAGRQVVVLGMQDHGQVEGGGIFQGAAQGAVVVEAVQAIAKGHATGVAQGHQLGQLFAVEVFAQGADGEDLAVSGFAGAVENQLGHGRSVQHRFGLRRAAQAGHAAGGGGQGFSGNRAFAAVAGFAQGYGQVDQAGGGYQAGGVDGLVGDKVRWGLAEGGDFAALQVQVGDLVELAGRVDHAGAEDTGTHQFCSSLSWLSWRCAAWPLMAMDSTAMRMAMP